MRIKTNYFISRYILAIFIFLTLNLLASPLHYSFLHYILNVISLGNLLEIVLTLFAILLALYTFFANQRDIHNNKIDEQIYLIGGVLSETDFIKENINWYNKEIGGNSFLKLDHPINRVHIENYLTRLNGKYFNKTGFALISNINDKIFQLNSRVSEGRMLYLNFKEKDIPPHKKFDKNYCLKIIEEVLNKIDSLREDLKKQKQIISKEEI